MAIEFIGNEVKLKIDPETKTVELISIAKQKGTIQDILDLITAKQNQYNGMEDQRKQIADYFSQLKKNQLAQLDSQKENLAKDIEILLSYKEELEKSI